MWVDKDVRYHRNELLIALRQHETSTRRIIWTKFDYFVRLFVDFYFIDGYKFYLVLLYYQLEKIKHLVASSQLRDNLVFSVGFVISWLFHRAGLFWLFQVLVLIGQLTYLHTKSRWYLEKKKSRAVSAMTRSVFDDYNSGTFSRARARTYSDGAAGLCRRT